LSRKKIIQFFFFIYEMKTSISKYEKNGGGGFFACALEEEFL